MTDIFRSNNLTTYSNLTFCSAPRWLCFIVGEFFNICFEVPSTMMIVPWVIGYKSTNGKKKSIVVKTVHLLKFKLIRK